MNEVEFSITHLGEQVSRGSDDEFRSVCYENPPVGDGWLKVSDLPGDYTLWCRPKQKEADRSDLPEVPSKPRNEAEYIVYTVQWVAHETNHDECWARWAREKRMRHSLNISVETRDFLNARVKARASELKLRGFPYDQYYEAELMTELSTYCSWFKDHHARGPASLLELAQFLDEERNRGQFANAPAVRRMFELSDNPGAKAWFEGYKDDGYSPF